MTTNEIEWVGQPLLAGLHHAHDSRLSQRSGFGSVAAPYLAVDHGGTNRLFATLIRCIGSWISKECEQVVQVLLEKLRKTLVGCMNLGTTDQIRHLHFQTTCHDLQAMRRYFIHSKAIAELEALKQQFFDAAGKRQRATGPAFNQRITSPKQVRKALLMGCRSELVVDRPAVMSKDPRPVDAQQSFCWLDASRRIHLVTRRRQAYKGMQPCSSSIDSPACFVADHLGRTSHRFADLAVGIFEPIACPKNASATGASADADVEKHFQESFDFAMTQAEFLVEQGHRGMNVRPELRGSRTGGVGSLQFMTSLNRTSASAADTGFNIELAVDDSARNFSLELSERVGLSNARKISVGGFGVIG